MLELGAFGVAPTVPLPSEAELELKHVEPRFFGLRRSAPSEHPAKEFQLSQRAAQEHFNCANVW